MERLVRFLRRVGDEGGSAPPRRERESELWLKMFEVLRFGSKPRSKGRFPMLREGQLGTLR